MKHPKKKKGRGNREYGDEQGEGGGGSDRSPDGGMGAVKQAMTAGRIAKNRRRWSAKVIGEDKGRRKAHKKKGRRHPYTWERGNREGEDPPS